MDQAKNAVKLGEGHLRAMELVREDIIAVGLGDCGGQTMECLDARKMMQRPGTLWFVPEGAELPPDLYKAIEEVLLLWREPVPLRYKSVLPEKMDALREAFAAYTTRPPTSDPPDLRALAAHVVSIAGEHVLSGGFTRLSLAIGRLARFLEDDPAPPDLRALGAKVVSALRTGPQAVPPRLVGAIFELGRFLADEPAPPPKLEPEVIELATGIPVFSGRGADLSRVWVRMVGKNGKPQMLVGEDAVAPGGEYCLNLVKITTPEPAPEIPLAERVAEICRLEIRDACHGLDCGKPYPHLVASRDGNRRLYLHAAPACAQVWDPAGTDGMGQVAKYLWPAMRKQGYTPHMDNLAGQPSRTLCGYYNSAGLPASEIERTTGNVAEGFCKAAIEAIDSEGG